MGAKKWGEVGWCVGESGSVLPGADGEAERTWMRNSSRHESSVSNVRGTVTSKTSTQQSAPR